jgi:hypothetical protein
LPSASSERSRFQSSRFSLSTIVWSFTLGGLQTALRHSLSHAKQAWKTKG